MAGNVIMAIFAHPDDELGCVGTLANHSDAGDDVHLVFLTKGENASTIGGTNEDRIRERKNHTSKIEELLKIKIHFMDFPDSKIEYNIQGAYEVAEKIKEIRPQAIITWNENVKLGSGHPDHRNCSKLVMDAISYARYRKEGSQYEPHRIRMTTYQYYDPQIDSHTVLKYVDVTHQYGRIMKFIEIYQEAYGDWPVKEIKESWMRSNGFSSQVKYAEVFKIMMVGYPAGKLLDITPKDSSDKPA